MRTIGPKACRDTEGFRIRPAPGITGSRASAAALAFLRASGRARSLQGHRLQLNEMNHFAAIEGCRARGEPRAGVDCALPDRKHHIRARRKLNARVGADNPPPDGDPPVQVWQQQCRGWRASLAKQDVGHHLVVAWRRRRTIEQDRRIVARRVLSAAALDCPGNPDVALQGQCVQRRAG